MRQDFLPCVVIPVYNHAQFLGELLRRIRAFDLPCLVVNDGSSPEDSRVLERLCAETDSELLEQFPNQGKGTAVLLGMRRAAERGFTHCIQVDADGQHNVEDLPRLLTLARAHPDTLVTGVPMFDESVPRYRFISRYLTHVWVWIETLSLEIRDSMCGFRVYPLSPTLALTERVRVAGRMAFDTEVMVRLYWSGMPVLSLPTRVIYPDNGVSNFRLWRDNIAITWMHTRLCVGMLARSPLLLYRLIRRQLAGWRNRNS